MENNNDQKQVLPATPGVVQAANTQQVEPIAEEIVICDECGDTLWDKVLAQDSIRKQLQNKIAPAKQ